MKRFLGIARRIALTLAIVVSGTNLSHGSPSVVKVDPDHYTGKWLEIGRRPMYLTDGCVAGYTTYRQGPSRNEIIVEDGCRVGTPKGRLKTIGGVGTITDIGTTNAKLRVRYPWFITFNYWVLYKSPDKSWFISANPSMTDLWIYSRSVPSKDKQQRMVRKARELGYDARRLEFPPQ